VQVEPRLKEFVPCPCGCGLVGTTTRAHRDGTRHVRGCVCPRCRGRNVKRSSGNRERRVARRLGGQRAALSGALCGYDLAVPLRGGGFLYVEETTNQGISRGLDRWWSGKGVQTKVARLLALRGLRALVLPDLVVMPRADWEALVQIAGEDEETI
jgi:hypothetical protein